MTLEEATEAGLLADAFKALRKELAEAQCLRGPKAVFDANLSLPLPVLKVMTEFGLSYARNRLAELGVTVPEEPKG